MLNVSYGSKDKDAYTENRVICVQNDKRGVFIIEGSVDSETHARGDVHTLVQGNKFVGSYNRPVEFNIYASEGWNIEKLPKQGVLHNNDKPAAERVNKLRSRLLELTSKAAAQMHQNGDVELERGDHIRCVWGDETGFRVIEGNVGAVTLSNKLSDPKGKRLHHIQIHADLFMTKYTEAQEYLLSMNRGWNIERLPEIETTKIDSKEHEQRRTTPGKVLTFEHKEQTPVIETISAALGSQTRIDDSGQTWKINSSAISAFTTTDLNDVYKLHENSIHPALVVADGKEIYVFFKHTSDADKDTKHIGGVISAAGLHNMIPAPCIITKSSTILEATGQKIATPEIAKGNAFGM